MKYQDIYEQWLNDPLIEEADKKELHSIKDNPKEIEDRFYQELQFGTAGLRGIIGIGTNRINKYNIMKVTQGLADFINSHGKEAAQRGVAIAYDSRHYSPEFSETAACVLAGNGIKVYLYESLRATPQLSYTIRHYGAISGIVVTASHNPKEYNGYKVYWEDGAQIVDEIAAPLTEQIKKVTSLKMVKKMPLSGAIYKGLVKMLGQETDDLYLDEVKALSLRKDIDSNICIVYTPLNGTGKTPIRRVMKDLNYFNFHIVSEQADPDGDFTTVGYPNPEDPKAFEYAINLGKKINADILLATDPDCDRVAVMAKDKQGEYQALNGNQTGALLVHYILSSLESQRRLPGNGAIVKSIVTGDLGRAIADKFGIKTYEVLTGFKYICGKIREFEEKKKHTYIFGYEESIGYNAADFVRDKDAVMSSMLIVEMAAYYKRRNESLLDALEYLYEEFGYFREKLISMVKSGKEGQQTITNMMTGYRKDYPKKLGKSVLVRFEDYQSGDSLDIKSKKISKLVSPKSNVLRFFFDDGSWYAVRPSGTEPKIKLYMYSKADTAADADDKIVNMESLILKKLNSFA